jgi:hypothetical protein
MALTRDFRERIRERARRDPAFRRALLREAIDAMLSGDLRTGKAVLRNYINATVGFARLGKATYKSPKSLMRMFAPDGNPRAQNIFSVLGRLQRAEGVSFKLSEHVAKRAKANGKRTVVTAVVARRATRVGRKR